MIDAKISWYHYAGKASRMRVTFPDAPSFIRTLGENWNLVRRGTRTLRFTLVELTSDMVRLKLDAENGDHKLVVSTNDGVAFEVTTSKHPALKSVLGEEFGRTDCLVEVDDSGLSVRVPQVSVRRPKRDQRPHTRQPKAKAAPVVHGTLTGSEPVEMLVALGGKDYMLSVPLDEAMAFVFQHRAES